MDSSFEPLGAAAARLETEPTRTRSSADHFAQFYIQHETLIDSVATYVVEGIEKGAGAIVIATQTHQTALQARWTSSHFDFDDASDRGQLLLLDAAETLAEFMVQGAPDSDRFHRSVGQIVARVSEQYPRVVAFGEMVSVLWAQGNSAAAVTLEELWNELSRRYPLTLFCGYALSDCIDEKADQAFEQVCCAHSHVIPAESYHPASNEEHRRQIAQLQRKALALELRLARDNELRHSLAQLAAIVESSDDAIVAETLDGTIQSWNQAAQRLFGYSAREAIGKSITLITPPELLSEEQRILEAIQRGESLQHFETTRLTKDGHRVEVSLTISPVRDESGALIGASKIARDITERKQADRLLRDTHADLQVRTQELARFNAAAVDRESRILALKRDVNHLRARLGEAAQYSFDGSEPEAQRPNIGYCADVEAAPGSDSAKAPVALESILITEQLSQRRRRAPDYQAESAALTGLVQALADAPDSILQALADKVLDVLHTGSAGLSLLDHEGERFYWAAIAGQWSPHVGGGTPRDFGPCGDVLDRNAPLLFTHWERRYPYLEAATPLAEEGLLVPFHVGGKAVGTIWAISHDPERKFDAEDLRLLQSLGRFASAAQQALTARDAVHEHRAALSLLEDAVQARALAETTVAKLRDSEQLLASEADSLEKLNDWSSHLWSCSGLQEGMEAMLDAVMELMGADKGYVQLLDDDGYLKIEAQHGFDQPSLDRFGKLASHEQSACGRALRASEPVVIQDVARDELVEPMCPIARAAGSRAVVSMPLVAADRSVQGMVSTHFRSTRQPTASETRRLALYARHASDFIHRCKMERELRQREEALREADHRKDEFLALLAHELRNPLAPIRYALAANRQAECTPAQRRWADDIMERQVTHMSRLLDDLLDISRITRGTLELKKAPTELLSVLSTAVETARPLLDSKQHNLSLDFPNEATRIEADAVRLAQVFSNLLVNAAKYTDPRGKIQLRARYENDEVVVSVRDSGIGISAEMMPRLFTMFTQANGNHGRSEGGLGVGLALIRGIVSLHGGTVSVKSDGLGHGSEFTVRIPVGEVTLDTSQIDGAESNVSAVGARILIVDDNRDAADSCSALLQLSGHHVQTAYTGREALDLAATFRPHAMLLDIGLPDLSGYALAKRIRETAWGRDTVLVAVTGWGQKEDMRRTKEAGFDHHLVKPVRSEALASALQMTETKGHR